MPIADDLREIAERAHRELDAVHDFLEHSRVVWESFQQFVEAGHTVSYHDLTTGTTVDQQGLLGLAPSYYRQYLATFTFRQFVSIFEIFLFTFLHRILLHNPWQFAKSTL